MATVYVVQESPGKNILPAEAYGNIEVLLPNGQVTFATQPTIHKLRERLKDFTENDFLLMIGDPVAISLAAIVASRYSKTVKFLKWDKQENRYVAVTADF